MTSQHYNINQLRIDLWNELKEKSNHITRLQKNEGYEDCLKDLNTLLLDLLSIERYFSFPGASLVSNIIHAIEKQELKAVSNQVAEIVALLVSDNYRIHPEMMDEKTNRNYTANNNDKSSCCLSLPIT